jgi:lysophospholipase L1-like esterase
MEFTLRFKLLFVAAGLCVGAGLILALVHLGFIGDQTASYENLDELRASIELGQFDDINSLADIIEPNSNDHIIYQLRPNLKVEFADVPLVTNSAGLRGREISKSKPDDTYRIALLGDSFAFGWGVRHEETFGEQLAKNLNSNSESCRTVEVLNFGVPGYATFQEVYHFLESGLEFQPDIIFIFFVENDFQFPFYVRSMANPGKLVHFQRFKQLFKLGTRPEVRDEGLRMRGLGPNRSLAYLADWAADLNIPVFLTINPLVKEDRWIKKLSVLRDRSDISLISLRQEWKKIVERRGLKKKQIRLPTDPHPNAATHKIWGELLAGHFAPLVQERCRSVR